MAVAAVRGPVAQLVRRNQICAINVAGELNALGLQGMAIQGLEAKSTRL